jgi:hypothetical protein
MQLLHKAFTSGLVFNVGKSVTTGRDNTTIWGNIHHKTNRDGGKDCHGWPDDTYFDRVKSECAAQGIYSDEMAQQMLEQQGKQIAEAKAEAKAGGGGGSSNGHGAGGGSSKADAKMGDAALDEELEDVQQKLQAAMAKGACCVSAVGLGIVWMVLYIICCAGMTRSHLLSRCLLCLRSFVTGDRDEIKRLMAERKRLSSRK